MPEALASTGDKPKRRESGEDARIVRAAAAGDERASRELVARYWDDAYRAAYLILADGGLAEDVAQEAFLAALKNLDSGGDDQPGPPLSAQEVKLSEIACSELGGDAKTVSWCGGLGATTAEVEELLTSKGYELFTAGSLIAIKSPDGTVMVTSGDGPPYEGPPIHMWGRTIASGQPGSTEDR
jgi:hypothetical protein